MADTDTKDRSALENLEIEITPKMVEAGVSELSGYSWEWDSADETVSRIYRIMEEERRSAEAGQSIRSTHRQSASPPSQGL